MKFIVTIVDADTREVLAMSEQPVEGKYLVAEGRDVAQEAFDLWTARDAADRRNR